MMRSAIFQVGINAYGLNGCVNDVINVASFFADERKLRFTQAHRLLDHKATKAALEDGIRWLVNTQADFMLFQFSGHGTQVPDLDKDEDDKLDEALVPVDYLKNGVITDDWLAREFAKVAPGKRLIVWLDACHSGTLTRSLVNAFTPRAIKATFNLSAPRFLPPGRIPAISQTLRGTRGLFSRSPKGVSYTNERVIGLKAAKDKQTAADAWIEERGQYCGAATHYILLAMRQLGPRASFRQIAALATKHIKAARYTQDIQFTGNEKALAQPFV